MFPGGMNPRQMQGMLKQMGIKTTELESIRVTIELQDGGKIIIDGPQTSVMDMKGQKIFTIMGGDMKQDKGNTEPAEEDIKMVMEQAKVGKERAMAALKKNDGDIAAAILELKGMD